MSFSRLFLSIAGALMLPLASHAQMSTVMPHKAHGVNDSYHCVIAKQVHRVSGKVLTANRVCGNLFDTTALFTPAQMQRYAPTDAYGVSHLTKAEVRFLNVKSSFANSDGRTVKLSLAEIGPYGKTSEQDSYHTLTPGQPVRIQTASLVDIELLTDISHEPNSFEQRLNSENPNVSNPLYQGAHQSPSMMHNGWNPWAWQNMSRKEREGYIYNQHPHAKDMYPPR